MGKIKMSRVLIGGLVAGVVINVFNGVLNGLVLADRWSAYMQSLGKPAAFAPGQLAGFNLIGFAMGILTVRLYAAIRPRFGSGPQTAVRAGLVIWLIGTLFPSVTYVITGLAPANLTYVGIAVGIVEYVVAGLAGAALYKESEASVARAMTA